MTMKHAKTYHELRYKATADHGDISYGDEVVRKFEGATSEAQARLAAHNLALDFANSNKLALQNAAIKIYECEIRECLLGTTTPRDTLRAFQPERILSGAEETKDENELKDN